MAEKDREPGAETVGADGADLVSAIGQLVEALEQSQPRLREALEKGKALGREGVGRPPWSEVMLSEEPPQLHVLFNDALQVLLAANSCYRRALARALYREGLTMHRIAELFGVSRQRVSHMLRPDSDDNATFGDRSRCRTDATSPAMGYDRAMPPQRDS